MAKRMIDPHLTPHPVLPGRAVSGRILPSVTAMTGAVPPLDAPITKIHPRAAAAISGGGAHLLPALPPVMIASVKPRAARPASKPYSIKAKPAAAKAKTACRPRGKK
ncbi:hypothetical protein CCAX7_55270 [Capsulimonas corticalis]|uniref:Uncharacterized protein n=1 Tax=Capsulimonas corticalis TaxID=2219043 RepID=A0A402D5Q5_9BACT|nr:hypothetical protein [Capsulimonas corticalis]BDI33476.1 hypothetical protein CCAX7_55270 [Capsulimonas corticalis]